MFRRETFIARVAKDAMGPRVRMRDYVSVDPGDPVVMQGRLVTVRDPGRGGESVVRLLIKRDGRRVLRALDDRCPERTVNVGDASHIRDIAVLVANRV